MKVSILKHFTLIVSVDHILFWSNVVHSSFMHVRTCKLENQVDLFEHTVNAVYYHIMNVFESAYYLIGPMEVNVINWKGYVPFTKAFCILLQILGFATSISWPLLDLLIMIYSIGLSHLFQQINMLLKRSMGKVIQVQRTLILFPSYRNISFLSSQNMPETFWAETRGHYLSLVDLVRSVDDSLAWIILLSCANNMYNICVQLFKSFQ